MSICPDNQERHATFDESGRTFHEYDSDPEFRAVSVRKAEGARPGRKAPVSHHGLTESVHCFERIVGSDSSSIPFRRHWLDPWWPMENLITIVHLAFQLSPLSPPSE
jgi:hypothetical protein